MGSLLLLGPGLVVLGWLLLIANAGRGANDAWMLGHYVLFIGNLGWLPLIYGITGGSSIPPTRRHVILLLALAGTAAIAAQLVVDMVAWALQLDQAGLRDFFATLRARPVLTLTIHTVGPALLFLAIFLAAAERVRLGGPAAVGGRLAAAGSLLVLGGALSTFSVVTLAGFVVILAGFAVVVARSSAAGDGA